MELHDSVYEKIQQLSQQGNSFVDKSKLSKAIQCFEEAIQLLPNPKEDWEASTWLYTALGDTYFQDKQYHEALLNLSSAFKCPNGLGNPFIMLRMGESLYEIADMAKAREYLLQAYMLVGPDIFKGEDPGYLAAINDLL